MSRASTFDDLFNGLQDPALVLDARSGVIKAANHAAAGLLGYPQETLEGMTAADFHAHELPRLREFLRDVCRHGAWESDALSCRTRDGEFVPAEIRSTVFRPDADGDDELLMLIRDLRGEQLAEVGRSVRKLVHDLRNAPDDGAASVRPARRARGRTGPRRSRRDVALPRTRAAALPADHARRQRRGSAPGPTRFMLDDVVEEVQATTVLPGGIGPQLHFDPDRSALLEADFDQVYRILLNLVRNASDAGAQHVTIAGRRDGAATRVTVTDDGPGLPDAIREQLDDEKPATGSTGLGLMIASELARGHGGRLEVTRTGPDGTVFEILLPDQD